jgi:hypothetical protein
MKPPRIRFSKGPSMTLFCNGLINKYINESEKPPKNGVDNLELIFKTPYNSILAPQFLGNKKEVKNKIILKTFQNLCKEG